MGVSVKKPYVVDSSTVTITSEKSTKLDESEPADFETAISATEYGKFNYLLLLLSLPCCLASQFTTSTVSFILPSAQCDLKLTLFDKGLLNATTYAGMISSAFLWGYLADTMGRKKLLVFGYLLNGFCDINTAFSQTLWYMMMFKFLGGFVICGPFAVLMSYLTEFHGVKYRARVMLLVGIFFSIGNIVLCLVGLTILPYEWNFTIIDNFLVFHSWQLFLIVCSIPTIISGILMNFFPESPKFLMSQGDNFRALQVFQTVYMINTGNSKDKYPIKHLISEVPQKPIKTISSDILPENGENTKTELKGYQALKSGLSQMAPMLKKPLRRNCMLVFLIQFFILLGLNTLRLWLPQLFAIITEYGKNNANIDSLTNLTRSDATLCDMIDDEIKKMALISDTANESVTCNSVFSIDIYINAMYVAVSGVGLYLIAGILIKAVGNKKLIVITLFTGGIAGMCLYFAKNSLVTLILSAIYVGLGSISSMALVSVTVNLIPTSLRTMTVSLTMMFGRVGSLFGNLGFPLFLGLGCLPPFFLLGFVFAFCGFLCLLLPNTDSKALE